MTVAQARMDVYPHLARLRQEGSVKGQVYRIDGFEITPC